MYICMPLGVMMGIIHTEPPGACVTVGFVLMVLMDSNCCHKGN